MRPSGLRKIERILIKEELLSENYYLEEDYYITVFNEKDEEIGMLIQKDEEEQYLDENYTPMDILNILGLTLADILVANRKTDSISTSKYGTLIIERRS